MTTRDWLADAASSFTSWAVAAVGAGAVWLVRMVFTNHKQIALLQQDIQARDKNRQEDRELIKDVQTEVRHLNGRIDKVLQTRKED